MLKQALILWKTERRNRKTTLHNRLILFFLSITVTLVLTFSLLLMLFGITGTEEKTVSNYLQTELENVVQAIDEDFGGLSVDGLNLAESITASCVDLLDEQGIPLDDLAAHPEVLEELLGAQMPFLLGTVNHRACGGVFLLLDATVNPDAENAANARAGIFIKKTQPTSTQAVGVKLHYLRGPAQVARDNNIELLGQWRMEFDVEGEPFFDMVMDTARDNPGLALSRLYYWSGRATLAGNSEAGFLLCVPLRSRDGTVFGVCGIEVSDRMFKQLYSPNTSAYEYVFAVAAPREGDVLHVPQSLIAGNYYLTGYRIESDLTISTDKDGFEHFSTGEEAYGGLSRSLKLYPSDSPYAGDNWTAAIMLPDDLLETATQGNSHILILIVAVLLVLSIVGSVFISRHYLQPVTTALDAIRAREYGHPSRQATPYLEISDLFDFLAQKDLEHEAEKRALDERHQSVQSEFEKTKRTLSHLAEKKQDTVDPESYALFLSHLKSLTPKEKQVFRLYLEGKHAKEIVEIMGFTNNALKYHNKNIYSKLGVSSRKELLMYAALLDHEGKAGLLL